MKHIFIVNPAAGPKNASAEIRAQISACSDSYDILIHETQGVKDATHFVREYASSHPEEKVRFYACGGDGTLNEVINGAYGYANASVSCYPCGSGNDFVKYYGGASYFLDIAALLEAEEREVDLLTDGEDYSVNVANFGFEYFVCEKMTRLRRKAFFKGKRAYYGGILSSLLTKMKSRARVIADGKQLGGDKILLCSVANGSYVGGSFHCAPRSDNEDGMLEVCLVDPISVPRFLSLISLYENGTHLDDARMKDIVHYTRARTVEVFAEDEGFGYVFDGELKKSKHFILRILPRALRFAVPRSALAVSGLLGKKESQKAEV